MRLSTQKGIPSYRSKYIETYFNAIVIVLMFTMLSFVWGVDYDGLLLVASSFFAVAGVALFAQWSLLSNLTASIIIFFIFPARIGDKINRHGGDPSLF